MGTAIGDPYTAFLLGYPDYTEVSTTNNPTMDGLGYSYAFYGQDDWHVTPNLTLNLGLALRTASSAEGDALQHRGLHAGLTGRYGWRRRR